MPVRSGGSGRLIALVPAVVTGCLMFVISRIGAARPILSWDEVATVDVAGRSVGQIWHLIKHVDAVFGPYYYLMHFWTGLAGDSAIALRLPSMIAMAAAVALTAELGRRIFTPMIGLLSGILLCLVPAMSRYAAEARPYAFACFFAVLATLLLHRARQRPGLARWLAYGTAVTLLGLSHLVALTIVGAHLGILLLNRRPGGSWRPVLTGLATMVTAVLLLVPLLLLGNGQQGVQISWVEPLTLKVLRASPAELTGAGPVGWLLAGLVLAAFWRPVRALAGVAVLVAVPLAAVATASVLFSPLWVARYLLFVLLPVAVLAAVGVAGPLPLPRRQSTLRAALVVALLAFVAYPAQYAVRIPTAKNGADYRGIARIIRERQEPGDGIVFQVQSRALTAGTAYYLRDDPGRPRDLLTERSAADIGWLVGQEYRDPVAHATGTRRIWLLVSSYQADPTAQRTDLRPLLSHDYRQTGIWHLKWATLALYTSRR